MSFTNTRGCIGLYKSINHYGQSFLKLLMADAYYFQRYWVQVWEILPPTTTTRQLFFFHFFVGCQFYSTVTYWCGSTSIALLCAIGMERTITICHQKSTITVKGLIPTYVQVMVALSYAWGGAWAILPLIGTYRMYRFKRTQTTVIIIQPFVLGQFSRYDVGEEIPFLVAIMNLHVITDFMTSWKKSSLILVCDMTT